MEKRRKFGFFRTQSGLFYYDFYLNEYIALGWDLVSALTIKDPKSRNNDKKEIISELYPEEKRPGLIVGQMDTFYNKMCAKDLVVIPSEGTRRVAIGVIGDIISEVKHKYPDDEYKKCESRVEQQETEGGGNTAKDMKKQARHRTDHRCRLDIG